MREIVEIKINGQRLVGTAHWPDARRTSTAAVLFLNSGFLPRSPVGDLPTHLSDQFANLGLVSFRFDMPGLGDSEGDLPKDVESFFGSVLNGLHGETAAALTKKLISEFNLSAIYLGGICGGAVSSIYAAATGNCGALSGIFLLDPRFQQLVTAPEPKKAAPGQAPSPAAAAAPVKRTLKRRIEKQYEVARVKVLSTKAGERARSLYHVFKPAVVKTRKAILKLRGEPLPADTNVPVITAMKSLCRQKLPILLLMAGSEAELTEKFDFVKHITTPNPGRLTCKYLPKVSHAFTEADGETLVLREMEQWFNSLAKPPRREKAEPTLEPALA